MDIIEFGWNYHFAVSDTFNLNTLRQLMPVKEEGKKFIPADEDTGSVRILLNKSVTFHPDEVEEAKLEKAESDVEQYSRWWKEEQGKSKKLEEELKCLKLDLEKIKKGE